MTFCLSADDWRDGKVSIQSVISRTIDGHIDHKLETEIKTKKCSKETYHNGTMMRPKMPYGLGSFNPNTTARYLVTGV